MQVFGSSVVSPLSLPPPPAPPPPPQAVRTGRLVFLCSMNWTISPTSRGCGPMQEKRSCKKTSALPEWVRTSVYVLRGCVCLYPCSCETLPTPSVVLLLCHGIYSDVVTWFRSSRDPISSQDEMHAREFGKSGYEANIWEDGWWRERERGRGRRRQHEIEVRIRGESSATTCFLSQLMCLWAWTFRQITLMPTRHLLWIGNKDPCSKCDPYHRLLQLTTCCAASFSLSVMQSFLPTLNLHLLANAK